MQVSQYSHLHTAHASPGLLGWRQSSANAIATYDGHSFHESCVKPNHMENVDAPAQRRRKHASRKTTKNAHQESAGVTSDCIACDAEGLFSCECRTDTQYHTFPLLVALDSLGSITCVRISTSPEPPVKYIAKVSASHVSGVSADEDCY